MALRRARKALGLTQADLSMAAGVGLRFVVELEAGKPTVRLELVLRVIDALGGSTELSLQREMAWADIGDPTFAKPAAAGRGV